jgi:PIN domain nuclease of toxin-antitoxin system
VIHLDTHVVVWLATGLHSRLSRQAHQALSREPSILSPMAVMELQILHEIGRLQLQPEAVLEHLRSTMGLETSQTGFDQVVSAARTLTWTRDPFDRLICAAAIADGVGLVTADRRIRRHLPNAIW